MSASGELLRLQADGEERLHSVHVGRVRRLPGAQCARTAPAGLEALLQVGTLDILGRVCGTGGSLKDHTCGLLHVFVTAYTQYYCR